MKSNLLRRLTAMVVMLGFAVMVNAQSGAEAVEALKDGVAKKGAKDYVGAIASFKKCIEIYEEIEDPDNDNAVTAASQIPGTQYKHALTFYKSKDYDKAIAEFNVLAEYSQTYNDEKNAKRAKGIIPQLYYFKGKQLAENKDAEGAIENYNKAIELNSKYFDPYFRLAEIYSEQGNEELFVVNIKKAIESAKKPEKKDAAVKVASSYYLKAGADAVQAEKYAEAEKYINASTEYKDADSDIYYQLAVIYNKQSKFDKGIEACNKAIETFANPGTTKDAKIYFELGNAYAGKGDNAAACDAYTKANKGDYAEAAAYQMKHVLKCN